MRSQIEQNLMNLRRFVKENVDDTDRFTEGRVYQAELEINFWETVFMESAR